MDKTKSNDGFATHYVSVTGDGSPIFTSDGRIVAFKDGSEAEKFVLKELVEDTDFGEASAAMGERYCPRVLPWKPALEVSWLILGRTVRIFESAEEAVADMDKLQEMHRTR